MPVVTDEQNSDAKQSSSDLSLRKAVADGIGGVRGIVESSVPPIVFIAVNMIAGLKPAIWAALGVAGAIAVWRLLQKDTIRHAVTGAVGVAIGAMIAAKTGKAEGFFIPGIVMNFVYGGAFAISAMIGRPLVGYGWSLVTGAQEDWRDHSYLVRAFSLLSWVWAGMFVFRGAVQTWLAIEQYTVALGIVRILGIAPYAAALALTVWYGRRVIRLNSSLSAETP